MSEELTVNCNTDAAAASSSEIPTKQSIPRPNTRRVPRFRRFKRQGQIRSSDKRSSTNFKNECPPVKVTTFTLRPCYEYHLNIYGLRVVVQVVYDILSAMDHHIAKILTFEEIYYAALLVSYHRLAQVQNVNKTSVIQQGLSYLRQAVSGILLPEPIVRFIESMGKVSTRAGYDLIPYFRDYHMLGSEDFEDPADILYLMDRQPVYERWGLDFDVLVHYQQHIARAVKKAIPLREVDNTELNGRPEFLVSYKKKGQSIEPRAFEEMDGASAQLGACFMFRDVDRKDQWLGMYHEQPFGAPEIIQKVHLNSWALNLMR